jgi:hypothetical protein
LERGGPSERWWTASTILNDTTRMTPLAPPVLAGKSRFGPPARLVSFSNRRRARSSSTTVCVRYRGARESARRTRCAIRDPLAPLRQALRLGNVMPAIERPHTIRIAGRSALECRLQSGGIGSAIHERVRGRRNRPAPYRTQSQYQRRYRGVSACRAPPRSGTMHPSIRCDRSPASERASSSHATELTEVYGYKARRRISGCPRYHH